MMKPVTKPDYIAIATPLVKRGFRVTPVSPATKRCVKWGWQKPSRHDVTIEDVLKTAAEQDGKYADHNVGVIGWCGDPVNYPPARHMFIDIDGEGVLERIEEYAASIGEKMPETFTVTSNPKKPYKLHFYFLQTAYSFNQFGGWHAKNKNVKDMKAWTVSKRTGKPMRPTLYDVRGIGGGAIVVAPGSVRDDGSLYTIIKDKPVVEIPNWLVDWINAHFKKYRDIVDAERAAKWAAKWQARREIDYAGKKVDAVLAELRAANDPAGFDIDEIDTTDFMMWRAGHLARLGCPREAIEISLKQMVVDSCPNGKAFVESDEGKLEIHEVAYDDDLKVGHDPKAGRRIDALWFYRQGRKVKSSEVEYITDDDSNILSIIPPPAPESALELESDPGSTKPAWWKGHWPPSTTDSDLLRHLFIKSRVLEFPDRILAEDVNARLNRALTGGFNPDKPEKAKPNSRQAELIRNTMRWAGFELESEDGKTKQPATWVRVRHLFWRWF